MIKMKTILLTAVTLISMLVTAQAGTYTYMCKVGSKSYPVTVTTPSNDDSEERINDQRKAAGEVVAGTAVEPHLRAVLAGNDAEAVVLDFVQPFGRRMAAYRFWLGDTAR
jgi:hypothetical protein